MQNSLKLETFRINF